MGITNSADHLLFTPGPLTTSRSVKLAMLQDLGSRDSHFIQVTQKIRRKLLHLAGVGQNFTSVLMQGSGTFGVESVISSTIPRGGKLLVIANGAYGARIAEIARFLEIDHHILNYLENQIPNLKEIGSRLSQDSSITHVAMVHCETTSGIFNPIEDVGRLCNQFQKTYIVDAMSSFGAAPIDFEKCYIDYLISSANKCIEGVPGLAFVIARRQKLENTAGFARSLSLDLHAQWKSFESTGEFRYTPPIQTVLALAQALDELDEEGGIIPRSVRYQENHQTLLQGMTEMGFKTYLPHADLGYLITSFHYLNHPNFKYQDFYERLQKRGFVIYSGKVTDAACFRIGNIGRIFKSDIQNLLSAIRDILTDMKTGSS